MKIDIYSNKKYLFKASETKKFLTLGFLHKLSELFKEIVYSIRISLIKRF